MSGLYSDLNKAFYGDGFNSKKSITMEDIVKCKGHSQGRLSRIYWQVKTRLNKGSFVTERTIQALLISEQRNKLQAIDKTLKASFTAKVSKERRVGADLAKIFSESINWTDTIAKSNSEGWDGRLLQSNLSKAYLILKTVRILESYSPEDILRAAAFEANLGKKGGGQWTGQLAKDFASFLRAENPPVKNKKQLNAAYERFINSNVLNFIELAPQEAAKKMKLEAYQKDETLQVYFFAIAESEAGLSHDSTFESYRNMPLNKLLSLFNNEQEKMLQVEGSDFTSAEELELKPIGSSDNSTEGDQGDTSTESSREDLEKG